ncbi:MAG: hypothetical protein ACR2NZ_00870 [Rubripirellula sp.]
MSDSFPMDASNSKRQIESVIRAARNYVRPSDELRPRTLDAARERCGDRRAEQKLGGFATAVLLLLTLATPAIRYADALRSIQWSPTAADVQQRAAEFGSEREIGPNWAMTEAFSQLRRVQADRLGHAYRSLR